VGRISSVCEEAAKTSAKVVSRAPLPSGSHGTRGAVASPCWKHSAAIRVPLCCLRWQPDVACIMLCWTKWACPRETVLHGDPRVDCCVVGAGDEFHRLRKESVRAAGVQRALDMC
jgi:hypothetical protein